MSKKKLLILPLIILVIFSIMGFTAFAAEESPTNNLFKVVDNNGKGDDITNKFKGETLNVADGFSLSSISGLKSEIQKLDKELNVSDFKFKTGAEIYINTIKMDIINHTYNLDSDGDKIIILVWKKSIKKSIHMF